MSHFNIDAQLIYQKQRNQAWFYARFKLLTSSQLLSFNNTLLEIQHGIRNHNSDLPSL